MITLNFFTSQGTLEILMRFTFSTTGEGGNNLPLFMGGIS